MLREPGKKTVATMPANTVERNDKEEFFNVLSWELTNSGKDYASGALFFEDNISDIALNVDGKFWGGPGLKTPMKFAEYDVTGMFFTSAGGSSKGVTV